jgi:hypothetical protein
MVLIEGIFFLETQHEMRFMRAGLQGHLRIWIGSGFESEKSSTVCGVRAKKQRVCERRALSETRGGGGHWLLVEPANLPRQQQARRRMLDKRNGAMVAPTQALQHHDLAGLDFHFLSRTVLRQGLLSEAGGWFVERGHQPF